MGATLSDFRPATRVFLPMARFQSGEVASAEILNADQNRKAQMPASVRIFRYLLSKFLLSNAQT
jgi:hypothetical protein